MLVLIALATPFAALITFGVLTSACALGASMPVAAITVCIIGALIIIPAAIIRGRKEVNHA